MNALDADADRDTGLRSPRLVARVGMLLGICITVCFLTGMLSHWIQHPPGWFYWPSRPVWLYQTTQGLHVITGVVAIPLLLIKLQLVYPKLFARPVIGTPARAVERASIAVLVSSTIFQLLTGLLNTAQWYPWKFFFTTTHYAMSFLVVASILVHIAVKLPIIQRALGSPVESTEPIDTTGTTSEPQRPTSEPAPENGVVSRRTVLRGTIAVGSLAVLAFAGQTVPFLRWFAFLAPRSGEGPQGIPINRTASAAGVQESARNPDYRLTISNGNVTKELTLEQLRAMPQHDSALPIACVEGWSATGRWSGVQVRNLVALVGGDRNRDVRFISLEAGLYGVSTLPANTADDPLSLVALRLHGEQLIVDHGYPCRLIAPNRPGVLQTKWLTRIEIL
ncbi:molybdopterin-dependent oxidoreductase [Williamsia sp. 1135]|uniref:molybdopterin-dependent oxidoreductase n=1 Tax=Williamsia sp. 1135 TaxID=1889262 RepID=UPI000A11D034|nr:molybdopterin-dependent oxidoreductase [Williamsia sp. 1135]ORM30591.1 molybdopterin-binding protein [Williamsia sp. 1135]